MTEKDSEEMKTETSRIDKASSADALNHRLEKLGIEPKYLSAESIEQIGDTAIKLKNTLEILSGLKQK